MLCCLLLLCFIACLVGCYFFALFFFFFFVVFLTWLVYRKEERKPLAKIDGATVDVDAIWERMNAPTSLIEEDEQNKKQKEAEPETDGKDHNKPETIQSQTMQQDKKQPQPAPQTRYPDEMVKIRRTYKFAGDVTTEEKFVPKDSAEAKLFLTDGKDGATIETVAAEDVGDNSGNAKAILKLRRPLRRISRFDPNPAAFAKKNWEKQPVIAAGAGAAEGVKGPKINTVEKSRLDWAAYVDQAGIKDELRVHSKAKEGYLSRMDFLDRVDAKREEERRTVRLRGL